MKHQYPSFEEESRNAMEGIWFFVGLTSQLPNDNDYFIRKIYSNEMIVRKREGNIKIFNNRCIHRGSPLFSMPTGNSNLKCPFHGWSFNDSGQLSAIPFNESYYDVDNIECQSLEEYNIELLGEFIFVNYSPNPPPIYEQFNTSEIDILKDISNYLDAHKSSTLIEAACNWKYLYEITIDPLHVPFVHHKTLNKLRPFKPEKALFNYASEISSIKDFSGVYETTRDPVKLYPWRQHVKRWTSKDVYIDIIIFPNLHLVTSDGGYSFSYEAFYPQDFNNTVVQYVFTTAKRIRDYSYFPVIHLESMRVGLDIYLEDIEMAERLQRTSLNYSNVNFQAKYEGKIYQFRNYFSQ